MAGDALDLFLATSGLGELASSALAQAVQHAIVGQTAILNQLEKRGGSASSSERGLAALIGTSRPTVRRAIHGLVLAGIVAAEASRNGTLLRLVA